MPRKRFNYNDPTNPFLVQTSLLTLPDTTPRLYNPWPWILRKPEEAFELVKTACSAGNAVIGLDFEYPMNYETSNSKPPTQMAFAVGDTCASVLWDHDMMWEIWKLAEASDSRFVVFAAVKAEKYVIEKEFKITTSLDRWEDAMLTHFLVNSDLTKLPGKHTDDMDSESLGLMNLWTAASLVTRLPNWKQHRGRMCEGPCPLCDSFGYNAVDAWAGLEIFRVNCEQMKQLRIPFTLYRSLLKRSLLCRNAEVRGIHFDVDYVDNLDKIADEKKEKLFPFEVRGKRKVFETFNPRSSQAGVKWFLARNVELKSSDVKDIERVLESRAKERNIPLKEFLLTPKDSCNETDAALISWYEFKKTGKGLKSWFDQKYVKEYITV